MNKMNLIQKVMAIVAILMTFSSAGKKVFIANPWADLTNSNDIRIIGWVKASGASDVEWAQDVVMTDDVNCGWSYYEMPEVYGDASLPNYKEKGIFKFSGSLKSSQRNPTCDIAGTDSIVDPLDEKLSIIEKELVETCKYTRSGCVRDNEDGSCNPYESEDLPRLYYKQLLKNIGVHWKSGIRELPSSYSINGSSGNDAIFFQKSDFINPATNQEQNEIWIVPYFGNDDIQHYGKSNLTSADLNKKDSKNVYTGVTGTYAPKIYYSYESIPLAAKQAFPFLTGSCVVQNHKVTLTAPEFGRIRVDGGGTANVTNGSTSIEYLDGTSPGFVFSITNDKYRIKGILVDGVTTTLSTIDGTPGYRFSNISADHTLELLIEEDIYEVNVLEGEAIDPIAMSDIFKTSFSNFVLFSEKVNNNISVYDAKHNGTRKLFIGNEGSDIDQNYEITVKYLSFSGSDEEKVRVNITPVNDAPRLHTKFTVPSTIRNQAFSKINLNDWIYDIDTDVSKLTWEVSFDKVNGQDVKYEYNPLTRSILVFPPDDFEGKLIGHFKVSDNHDENGISSPGVLAFDRDFNVGYRSFKVVSLNVSQDQSNGVFHGTLVTSENIKDVAIQGSILQFEKNNSAVKILGVNLHQIKKGGFDGVDYSNWEYTFTFSSTTPVYLQSGTATGEILRNYFSGASSLNMSVTLTEEGALPTTIAKTIVADFQGPRVNFSINENEADLAHSQILNWDFIDEVVSFNINVSVVGESADLDEGLVLAATKAANPEYWTQKSLIWNGKAMQAHLNRIALYDSREYKYTLVATDAIGNTSVLTAIRKTPSDFYPLNINITDLFDDNISIKIEKLVINGFSGYYKDYKTVVFSTGTATKTVTLENGNYRITGGGDYYSIAPAESQMRIWRANPTPLNLTLEAKNFVDSDQVFVNQSSGTGNLSIRAYYNELKNNERPAAVKLRWSAGMPNEGGLFPSDAKCTDIAPCSKVLSIANPAITYTDYSTYKYWEIVIPRSVVETEILSKSEFDFEEQVRYIDAELWSENDVFNGGTIFRKAKWSFPQVGADGSVLFAPHRFKKPVFGDYRHFFGKRYSTTAASGSYNNISVKALNRVPGKNTKLYVEYSPFEDGKGYVDWFSRYPGGVSLNNTRLDDFSLQANLQDGQEETYNNYWFAFDERYSVSSRANFAGEKFLSGYKLISADKIPIAVSGLHKTGITGGHSYAKMSWDIRSKFTGSKQVIAWVYISYLPDVETKGGVKFLYGFDGQMDGFSSENKDKRAILVESSGWYPLYNGDEGYGHLYNVTGSRSFSQQAEEKHTLDIYTKSNRLQFSQIILQDCYQSRKSCPELSGMEVPINDAPRFGFSGNNIKFDITNFANPIGTVAGNLPDNLIDGKAYKIRMYMIDEYGNRSDVLERTTSTGTKTLRDKVALWQDGKDEPNGSSAWNDNEGSLHWAVQPHELFTDQELGLTTQSTTIDKGARGFRWEDITFSPDFGSETHTSSLSGLAMDSKVKVFDSRSSAFPQLLASSELTDFQPSFNWRSKVSFSYLYDHYQKKYNTYSIPTVERVVTERVVPITTVRTVKTRKKVFGFTWKTKTKKITETKNVTVKKVTFKHGTHTWKVPFWEKSIHRGTEDIHFNWPIDNEVSSSINYRQIQTPAIDKDTLEDHKIILDFKNVNNRGGSDNIVFQTHLAQQTGVLKVHYEPGSQCAAYTDTIVPFSNRYGIQADNWVRMIPTWGGAISSEHDRHRDYHFMDIDVANHQGGIFLPNRETSGPSASTPSDEGARISMGVRLEDDELSESTDSDELYSLWVLGGATNTTNNQDRIQFGLDVHTPHKVAPVIVDLNAPGIQGSSWKKVASNLHLTRNEHTLDFYMLEDGVSINAVALIKNKKYTASSFPTVEEYPSISNLAAQGFSRWGDKGFEAIGTFEDLHADRVHTFVVSAVDRLGNVSDTLKFSRKTLPQEIPVPDIKVYHPFLDADDYSTNPGATIILTAEDLPEVPAKQIDNLEIKFTRKWKSADRIDNVTFAVEHVTGSSVWRIKNYFVEGSGLSTLGNFPLNQAEVTQEEGYSILVRGVTTLSSGAVVKGNWTEMNFGINNPADRGVLIDDPNYNDSFNKVQFKYKYGISAGTVNTLRGDLEVQIGESAKLKKNQKLMLEGATIVTEPQVAGSALTKIKSIEGGHFVAYQCSNVGDECETISELQIMYGRYPLRLLSSHMKFEAGLNGGKIIVEGTEADVGGFIVDDRKIPVGVINVKLTSNGVFDAFEAPKDHFFMKNVVYFQKGIDAFHIESCCTEFSVDEKGNADASDDVYKIHAKGAVDVVDPVQLNLGTKQYGPFLVFSLIQPGTREKVSVQVPIKGEDRSQIRDYFFERMDKPVDLEYLSGSEDYTVIFPDNQQHYTVTYPSSAEGKSQAGAFSGPIFLYDSWKMKLNSFEFSNNGLNLTDYSVILNDEPFLLNEGQDYIEMKGFAGSKVQGRSIANNYELHMFDRGTRSTAHTIQTAHNNNVNVNYELIGKNGWIFEGTAEASDYRLKPIAGANLGIPLYDRFQFEKDFHIRPTKATSHPSFLDEVSDANPQVAMSALTIAPKGITELQANGVLRLALGSRHSHTATNKSWTRVVSDVDAEWNGTDLQFDFNKVVGTDLITHRIPSYDGANRQFSFSNAAIDFSGELDLVQLEGNYKPAANTGFQEPISDAANAIILKSPEYQLIRENNHAYLNFKKPEMDFAIPIFSDGGGFKLPNGGSLQGDLKQAHLYLDGSLRFAEGIVYLNKLIPLGKAGDLNVGDVFISYDKTSKTYTLQGSAQLILGDYFTKVGLAGEVISVDDYVLKMNYEDNVGWKLNLESFTSSAFKMPKEFRISPADLGLSKGVDGGFNANEDYLSLATGGDALQLTYNEANLKQWNVRLKDWSMTIEDGFPIEGLRGVVLRLDELEYNSEGGLHKIAGGLEKTFPSLKIFDGFEFIDATISLNAMKDDSYTSTAQKKSDGSVKIAFAKLKVNGKVYSACPDLKNYIEMGFGGDLSSGFSFAVTDEVTLLENNGEKAVTIKDLCISMNPTIGKSGLKLILTVTDQFKADGTASKGNIGVNSAYKASGSSIIENPNALPFLSHRYGVGDDKNLTVAPKASLTLEEMSLELKANFSAGSAPWDGLGMRLLSLKMLDRTKATGQTHELGMLRLTPSSFAIEYADKPAAGKKKFQLTTVARAGVVVQEETEAGKDPAKCSGDIGLELSAGTSSITFTDFDWKFKVTDQVTLKCEVAGFAMELKDMKLTSRGLSGSKFMRLSLSRPVSKMIGADGQVRFRFNGFRWDRDSNGPKWDSFVVENYGQDFHVNIFSMKLMGRINFGPLFSKSPGIGFENISFDTGKNFGNTQIPTTLKMLIDGNAPYVHVSGGLPRQVTLPIPSISFSDAVKGHAKMTFGLRPEDEGGEPFFTGEGSISMPGFASNMFARLTIVQPSRINKTGIEEILVRIELSPSSQIPLGTTGFYITMLEGAFYDGLGQPASAKQCVSEGLPPGMKAEVAMYVEERIDPKKPGRLATARIGVWVQFNQLNFGVDGKAELLGKIGKAGVCAAILKGGQVFRSRMSVSLNIALKMEGKFGVDIWSESGKKFLAGFASATVVVPKGELMDNWLVTIPGSNWRTPPVSTKFGAFQNGKTGATVSMRIFGFSTGVGFIGGRIKWGRMNYPLAAPKL